jgi:hypothetical protein
MEEGKRKIRLLKSRHEKTSYEGIIKALKEGILRRHIMFMEDVQNGIIM